LIDELEKGVPVGCEKSFVEKIHDVDDAEETGLSDAGTGGSAGVAGESLAMLSTLLKPRRSGCSRSPRRRLSSGKTRARIPVLEEAEVVDEDGRGDVGLDQQGEDQAVVAHLLLSDDLR
jgi:hypothetical protein